MQYSIFLLLALVFASAYFLLFMRAMNSMKSFCDSTPRLHDQKDLEKLKTVIRTQMRITLLMTPIGFIVLLLLVLQLLFKGDDIAGIVFFMILICLNFIAQVVADKAERRIRSVPVTKPHLAKSRNQLFSGANSNLFDV